MIQTTDPTVEPVIAPTPTVDEMPMRSEETIEEGFSGLEPLGPQAIVAAYKQVLTDIYESVLPSIVQVKVQTSASTSSLLGGSQTPVRGGGFRVRLEFPGPHRD